MSAYWYKDAVIYELHVRAFSDSDRDGIGDFRGLISRLDYLRDLGVTALWLLPFYPSPLRDDGYDIADYTAVHPSYGTLDDFKRFLAEAHDRGLKVITELVLNHTSDQHPWFERARRAPAGSPERDFYVWSDSPDRYGEARIIFKDFEGSNWAWDGVAGAYYWHRFYSHQPDLNYDNPRVREALFEVVDFWLEMGVDGLRLDAVPYLFEQEDTNSENLPPTHAFLKDLRAHIDAKFDDRMLLAEANQWPEDAYDYFGDGDECQMAFHFPLMPRLFMALRREDRLPMVDIIEQTPDIPESAQWALFLRNHDELTLEMVTEQERAYMYRSYAEDHDARINLGIRRRLAPLLTNARRSIELLNGLLFSLNGTPVLYYGDEIGMGDNVYLGDRNGVRTPMQWSADRNAGFSQANPQQLYLPLIVDYEYHHESLNVETQARNPSSLLNWMKRLIAVRSRYRAFGRGSLTFMHPANRRVLAFVREYEDEKMLVVANLSRFSQSAELDLSGYAGYLPTEVFGQTPFPRIGELPYLLTLAPHAFYWFSLDHEHAAPSEPRPVLTLDGRWQEQISRPTALADALPAFLCRHRWFGGKARTMLAAQIEDTVELPRGVLAFVRVDYNHGDAETYVLPLAHAAGRDADRIRQDHPDAIVAATTGTQQQEGVLFDAVYDPAFLASLFQTVSEETTVEGDAGTMQGATTPAFEASGDAPPTPTLLSGEQSNTSIRYGDYVLKLYRRVEGGTHPEAEMNTYLAQRATLRTPALAGTLTYQPHDRPDVALGVLHRAVTADADGWAFSQSLLRDVFARAAGGTYALPDRAAPSAPLLDPSADALPEEIERLFTPSLAFADALATATAHLHLALADAEDDADFAPEPFTRFGQRSLYGSMRALAVHVFHALEHTDLPAEVQSDAHAILERKEALLAHLARVRERPLDALRIRPHANLHLGEVLLTDDGWQIIDFEGETARPLFERRIKSCALIDVTSMIRSFAYASAAALEAEDGGEALEPYARAWTNAMSARFLHTYLQHTRDADFLPTDARERALLLDAFLIQRMLYEIDYERNNRPDWLPIPLRGLAEYLKATADA